MILLSKQLKLKFYDPHQHPGEMYFRNDIFSYLGCVEDWENDTGIIQIDLLP